METGGGGEQQQEEDKTATMHTEKEDKKEETRGAQPTTDTGPIPFHLGPQLAKLPLNKN
jgi:hypothetical protein